MNIEDLMKELTVFKLNSSDPEAKLHVALNYDEIDLLATACSLAAERLYQDLAENEMVILSRNLQEMYRRLSSLIGTYFE